MRPSPFGAQERDAKRSKLGDVLQVLFSHLKTAVIRGAQLFRI
jgi:hypothetical protein